MFIPSTHQFLSIRDHGSYIFFQHHIISVKNKILSMAGVAQWIEHMPANQRVTSLIPSQGTCLGCRSGPQ